MQCDAFSEVLNTIVAHCCMGELSAGFAETCCCSRWEQRVDGLNELIDLFADIFCVVHFCDHCKPWSLILLLSRLIGRVTVSKDLRAYWWKISY